MTPAYRLAAAVQIGTFGIAWQGCPTHETGGAPPISAANQDLSAEHPRDLVALVHVHRASLADGHPATGDHQSPQSLRPACQRVKARLARRWRVKAARSSS